VFRREKVWQAWPDVLNAFKGDFIRFSQELIEEGKFAGEIADRFLVTGYYHHAIWMQVVFLLKFWVHDESDQLGDTDAAIDKAVNFGMDLMENNPLDSFLDLSKFIVQKW
jgi:hypothetical protein